MSDPLSSGYWPYSSPSSRNLSERITFLACGMAQRMHCRETTLLYSPYSSCRPPGVPRWSQSWSQLFSSTQRAPDIQSLDSKARSLVVPGLSASSRSTYAAGERRYLSFCTRANLNPLPVTEATHCQFVALGSVDLRVSLGGAALVN